MARSPARRTAQAADDIQAWLESRTVAPAGAGLDLAAAAATERIQLGPQPAGEGSAAAVDGADGRRPARPVADEKQPTVTPAHTDWLHHRLQVRGPATEIDAFRRAAAGAGVIPWHLDLDRMEEDFFLRLAAPPPGHARTLSMECARLLAADLRDAVARRHALTVARVGHSAVCPLDLHALLPVPATILQLGPDHPQALAWLTVNWGTTQALRHVAVEADPARRQPEPSGAAVFTVDFWSADWTPWQAMASLRQRWPALGVTVTPHYERA